MKRDSPVPVKFLSGDEMRLFLAEELLKLADPWGSEFKFSQDDYNRLNQILYTCTGATYVNTVIGLFNKYGLNCPYVIFNKDSGTK